MMEADGPVLVADAVESWVQELDPQHATQALLAFGRSARDQRAGSFATKVKPTKY